MKAVKLETGVTPSLRGELRARNLFGLHRSGLAGVNSKELTGEKIRVYLRMAAWPPHGFTPCSFRSRRGYGGQAMLENA